MKSLLLLLLLLSPLIMAACSESEAPSDERVTAIDVCRLSCSTADRDSVLGLTYENGVVITVVDTIGVDQCVSLPMSAFSDEELTRSDSVTFAYFKEDRRFFGPPRVHRLSVITISLAEEEISIGCR